MKKIFWFPKVDGNMNLTMATAIATIAVRLVETAKEAGYTHIAFPDDTEDDATGIDEALETARQNLTTLETVEED